MARRYLADFGAHALSHESFRLWRNHLVVGCDHVPRWKGFPRRRPGLCGEGVDAQWFLHCSHDASFCWVHIGGKCLGEAIPINPQEAMIVRRANRGSACGGGSLFAQTIQALAFVQGKGGDVYQRFYARHAVRSSGNYDAAVRVTDKHDWARQHAEQVLRHGYVCLDRSERQLSRHDVQTFLLQQGDHFAPGRSVRPRSVYEYYVCRRFHYRPFRPFGCSCGCSRSCDIHVLIYAEPCSTETPSASHEFRKRIASTSTRPTSTKSRATGDWHRSSSAFT